MTTMAPPRIALRGVGALVRRPGGCVHATADGRWTLCDCRITEAWRLATDAGGAQCLACRERMETGR